MSEGRILRIEKLYAFDGDGLHTVVFLKGCPLRHKWCSTPESHHMETTFGNQEDGDIFITDMTKCTDCQVCMEECLPGSRIAYGYKASVQEIVKQLEKDSLFYFHPGGGITISSGESFLQADFLCEFLENCIMLGMNTAIETCGFTHWNAIAKALPFL